MRGKAHPLCFDECHQLAHRSRHTTEFLSRVMRNEVQLAVSLLPLLVSDSSMPWSPTSYCSDISPYVYSVVGQEIGREEAGLWNMHFGDTFLRMLPQLVFTR